MKWTAYTCCVAILFAACHRANHQVPRSDDPHLPREDLVTIPAARYPVKVVHYRGDGVCTHQLGVTDKDVPVEQMLEDGEVELSAFQIDKHVATAADYGACVHAHGCPDGGFSYMQPDDVTAFGLAPTEDIPENHVQLGLQAASAYCAWRGMRVPTYAEWQAAVRGPQGLRHGSCDRIARPPRHILSLDDCRFTSPFGVVVWLPSGVDPMEWTSTLECWNHAGGEPSIQPLQVDVGWRLLDVSIPADQEHVVDGHSNVRCVRDVYAPARPMPAR